MKHTILPAFLLLSIVAYGQNESSNYNYSVFPKNFKKEFFISTNSGVLATPIGLKIGFIANPGVYVGFRHGIGKVYNSDSDLTTNAVNLYSVTAGLNKPLIMKGNFKLVAQVGVGYGQWWDF